MANLQSRGAPVVRPARVLFICGSLNQTTQLHAVARAMPDIEPRFTPFYGERYVATMRQLGLLESTIGGNKLRARCLAYLERNGLPVDIDGAHGGYDLVVSCTDVVIPHNLDDAPLVVVQEGILDPSGLGWHLVRRMPTALPRWLAGTAATGLSQKYQRFCVASRGYRDLFIARGAPAERVVVTGIPNFDDCAAYAFNDFPHRDYVLVCTSDARETLKFHNRKQFIVRAQRIAGRRPLFFKLHPNENVVRARREIEQLVPTASIYAEGPTEAMIANCSTLVTEWSSVAFVGLALGKEVFSSHSLNELRELMPEQNRSAARRIGRVCRQLLEPASARSARGPEVAA